LKVRNCQVERVSTFFLIVHFDIENGVVLINGFRNLAV